MNLVSFEDRVQAVFVAATGLPGNKVIWAHQSKDRPVRPFIELTLLSSDAGVFSETTHALASPSLPGAEIDLITKDNIELTVQAIAFSSEVVGAAKAFNLLQKSRIFFNRDNIVHSLNTPPTASDDSIAIVERSSVQDLSLLLDTEFEGRASLSLVFRVADTDIEKTTYIEKVDVEQKVITPAPVTYTDTYTIDIP